MAERNFSIGGIFILKQGVLGRLLRIDEGDEFPYYFDILCFLEEWPDDKNSEFDAISVAEDSIGKWVGHSK